MIRFAEPAAFQLFWLIPIIAAASILFERKARRAIAAAFGEKLAPYLSASVSVAKRRIKLVLMCLSLACFVVALARPQLGKSMQEVKVRGVEMVVAFDVSTSMLAEDVKPSRLEHAKAEVTRLLDLLGGDKVGLVAFAGSAVLVSPLTTDKSSLKMFVESLGPESVETQGTNVKAALDEARQAFERGGLENDENVRVTRVVLFVSDGEDQEKGALEEAQKLANDGTRIFTLAFGTERGAPIPLRDERGFLRNYKRDQSGNEVISRVKGDFLRELAQEGKGSFHHATFGGSEARLIKADLDKLEKAEFASELATNYDERFQIPLFFGVLFALLEMMIGDRKKQGRIWRGRFETAASWLLLVMLFSLAPEKSKASELMGIRKNNQGVSRFENGKPVEAFDRFTDALAELPTKGEVHYNIGNSFLVNKEFDKALSQYKGAIQLSPGNSKSEKEVRFRALFNSAIALTEQKKIDEALMSYQKALEIEPNSVETKTNIELLTSGGGGGGGEGESKEKKDGEGDQQQQQQQPQQFSNQPKEKPKPKPFNSKDLTQQDVGRILDELKRQEEQIRAKMNREGAKDAPPEKDW